MYAYYPQTLPTGKSRSDTESLDTAFLERRGQVWVRRDANGSMWGQPRMEYFDRYLGALAQWGMTPRPVAASEFVTSDYIVDINKFDSAAIENQAKAYVAK
jgi:hypothetical protein